VGDEISFTAAAIPQKEFSANISYIDPFLNAKTRVVQLRIELENEEQLMKPEMFVSGILNSQMSLKNPVIMVPQSAILWTGKRAVVYIKVPGRESPTFIYREIVLGAEAGDYYVVQSGLEIGEEIAVNGVFKIDASAQLSGLKSMMNPEGAKMSSQHQHGEMTHKEEADDAFAVYGNCSMCKERIETAALSVEGVEQALWEEDSKVLHLNHQEADLLKVHKALAAVGHDTDLETAADSVYEQLHACCKYTRPKEMTQIEIKVYGNCGMCKDRIETTVLGLQGVEQANWDAETTMLQMSYTPDQVSLEKIHEEIAAVGHDTELVRAPDGVYEQLHECCKYERKEIIN
jgi:Cu(I)/Ag(I) efflux system membrane fusion protein